jgi:hypothetical protein
MNPKPSDFFISVIDFFSVILPGALVTYFLKGQYYEQFFGSEKVFPAPETEVQGWIVFLFATYIIGNLIFAIGSVLLDGFVYDKWLRNYLFKKNSDLAYHTATAIRDQFIPSASWINQLVAMKKLKEQEIEKLYKKDKHEIINTFKWAQHYLAVKHPETLIDIRKFEADSKFFRSMVIASIIIAALLYKEVWISVCFLALLLLSLYRYGELRYKSTERAFEIIITVNHLEKSAEAEAGVIAHDNRLKFKAPENLLEIHRNRISTLTKGLQVSSELLAISAGEIWEATNLSSPETLYCLNGHVVGTITTGANGKTTIILTPGAIVPLSPKSSFEITNKQQEPLLLLSTK